MLSPIAPGIKYPSAIVIADFRRKPGSAQQQQSIQHTLQNLVKFRGNRNSIERRQNPGVQENIHSIDVVVSGLLKVESVVPDLLRSLTFKDFPPASLPPRSRSHARKESPQKEQSQSLTEKVCIGRKICGQISFDVSSAQAQGGVPLSPQLGREKRALLQ